MITMSQTRETEDLTWGQAILAALGALCCAVVLAIIGWAVGTWTLRQ